MLICVRESKSATSSEFAQTVGDLRGSANIVYGNRLETSREILLREIKEEGGSIVELLGTVREKSTIKSTAIEVGGPYRIEVINTYSKAVSQRNLELHVLRDALRRAQSDDQEIKGFTNVILPRLDVDENDLESRLRIWFASNREKDRASLVRIYQKICESVNYPNL